MASRATRLSRETRIDLIQQILDHQEAVTFSNLNHLCRWFFNLVGDGYWSGEGAADEVSELAVHSAVLTVQKTLQTALHKDLTVEQTIELLQAAIPTKK